MKRSGAERGEGNAGFIRETHGIFDMILERIPRGDRAVLPRGLSGHDAVGSVTV